jgi:hypothetical protein
VPPTSTTGTTTTQGPTTTVCVVCIDELDLPRYPVPHVNGSWTDANNACNRRECRPDCTIADIPVQCATPKTCAEDEFPWFGKSEDKCCDTVTCEKCECCDAEEFECPEIVNDVVCNECQIKIPTKIVSVGGEKNCCCAKEHV